jgi:hypothetical protein
MKDGQYYCWGCGLMFGEPDAPVLPSQLCPECKRNPPTPPEYEQHVADNDATGTK